MPFEIVIAEEGSWTDVASKWSVDEIPDLSGKVMIVTGGNTGIGRETVKVCHLFDDAVVCFTSRPLVSGLAAT